MDKIPKMEQIKIMADLLNLTINDQIEIVSVTHSKGVANVAYVIGGSKMSGCIICMTSPCVCHQR
jgi:hypothetical protein